MKCVGGEKRFSGKRSKKKAVGAMGRGSYRVKAIYQSERKFLIEKFFQTENLLLMLRKLQPNIAPYLNFVPNDKYANQVGNSQTFYFLIFVTSGKTTRLL